MALTREETAARSEVVTRLRKEGWSYDRIGAELGLSGGAVQDWAVRVLRLPKQRVPRVYRAAVVAAPNRTCLCCRVPFVSEGPHNRLCLRCNRLESPSPYAPNPGGGTGRRVPVSRP